MSWSRRALLAAAGIVIAVALSPASAAASAQAAPTPSPAAVKGAQAAPFDWVSGGIVYPVVPQADAASTYAITGKVTNAAHVGLADILILSYLGGDNVHNTSTASDGTYSIPAEPGAYTLRFSDGSSVYATGWYSTSGFTFDQAAASTVTVTSANRTGIDVTLPLFPAVSGTVTNAGGSPLPGMTLWLHNADGSYYTYSYVTSLDGTYSIPADPGSYLLELVGAPDYGSGWYSTSGLVYQQSQASPITVGSSGAAGIDVVLPATPHIRGQVTNGIGAAVQGVDVEAYVDGVYYSHYWTDAGGNYSVAVMPGNFTIFVRDASATNGSGWYSVSGFTRDAAAATTLVVVSSDVTGIDVALPDPLHVSGRATDGSGGGIPGVPVRLWSGGLTLHWTVTAADGTYSVAAAPDTYTVEFYQMCAAGSGWYRTSGSICSGSASSVVVSTADVSGIDGHLTSFRLMGTVTDVVSAGLPNITVSAYAGGSSILQTTTGADGRYTLLLDPGDYTIKLTDASGTYASGWRASAGFSYDQGAADTITIAAANVTGLDVALPLALHLSGTVTNSGAAGIPGIEVDAYQNGVLAAKTTTGANGTYSLTIVPGSYAVYFLDSHPSYGSGWYSPSGFTRDVASASVLSVTSSSLTGLDVTLPSPLQVGGRVVNGGHQGIPGIQVSAYVPGKIGQGTAGSNSTAADGSFAISLAPGTYLILVSGQSGSPAYYSGTWYCTAAPFCYSDAATPISVANIDLDGLDVTLPGPLLIKGRVADAGVGTTRVEAYRNGSLYSGVTVTSGSYALPVGPGTYTVHFWDSSGQRGGGWYSTGGLVADQAAASLVTVDLQVMDGIDVTMAASYRITGTVVDGASAGLPGVGVQAFQGGKFAGSAVTGATGSYSIAASPGAYTLRFVDSSGSHASGWYAGSELRQDPGGATVVTVGLADVPGIDVTLPGTRRIAGTVLDAGGHGIAGVAVDAYVDGGLAGSAATGATGTYSVVVPPGDVTLFYRDWAGAHGSGWRGGSGFTYEQASAASVTVSAADVSGVDLALPAALHITGTVADGGAVGISGIEVEAFAGGSLRGRSITDAGGAYSIVVAPGSYVVGFTDISATYAHGWYSLSGFTASLGSAGNVTITSADVGGIDVTLPTALHITGTVLEDYGSGYAGRVVEAFRDGSMVAWTTTSGGGNYSLLVDAGSYQLYFPDYSGSLSARGWYRASGFTNDRAAADSVLVESADVSVANIALPFIHWMTGLVTDANHTGLQRLRVQAYVNGSLYEQAITGNGIYNLYLAAGYYTLFVEDPTGRYVSGWYSSSGLTDDPGAATPVGISTNISGPLIVLSLEGVPLAPSGVTGIGLNGSARISWTAPADNGHPITGYAVTSGPSSPGCTTTGDLTCTVTGLTNKSQYSFTVTATNGNGTGPASAPVSATPRIGSTYYPLTPTPVVNSKTALGLTAALTPYTPATFQVTGLQPGEPLRNVPASANAVTGVLSVQDATYKGWVAITPEPDAAPSTSTINFPALDSRSTGVTVPLGADGKLSLTYGSSSPTSSVHVIFELTGYFVLGTGGSTYITLTPNRLLDSRPTASGHVNTGLSGTFIAGTARTFQVSGPLPAPKNATIVPSSAIAVTGTLTVTGQSAPGYLTIGPEPLDVPDTRSLFFPRGDNRATGLTVKLGAGGTLSVTFSSTTAGATTHAIFDVNGYFLPGTSGAMFVPITPNRIVDSRPTVAGQHTNTGLSSYLRNRVAATFAVTGLLPAPKNATIVPTGAVAITGTLTVTEQTYLGWLSLTPTPNNNPPTSNLNFPKGDNRATGVTVPLSSAGKCSVTYGAVTGARTNVLFDVSGYFVN